MPEPRQYECSVSSPPPVQTSRSLLHEMILFMLAKYFFFGKYVFYRGGKYLISWTLLFRRGEQGEWGKSDTKTKLCQILWEVETYISSARERFYISCIQFVPLRRDKLFKTWNCGGKLPLNFLKFVCVCNPGKESCRRTYWFLGLSLSQKYRTIIRK